MTDRRILPSRRASESFAFEHEGVRYHATVSRFADGSLGEVFLNAGKTGSAVDTVAHDAAVIFSIARQYGTPQDVIRGALAKLSDGSCAGAIGVALDLADAGGGA